MKSTAYSTRMVFGSRAKPVFPVRERGFTLPLVLFALILLGFFFTMTRLQVAKAHYGSLIQRQTERVEMLRGEVRALNGRLATATALPSVRERALERGMVEPDRPPLDLLVTLSASEVERMGGRDSRDVAELFARRWSGEMSGPPGGEGRP